MNQPIEFAILGLGAGAIYALIGQGLVLVYRGSGIINFAQGAVGMIGALLFHQQFIASWGWPPWLSMVAALSICSLMSAGVFFAIHWRLAHASAVTRTISTVGILIFLLSVANLLWGQDTGAVLIPHALLPQNIVDIDGYRVGADRLILFGIALVVTVVLWAASRFTLFGLATGAAVENEESATLLGWSPRWIGVLNWAAGGLIAAVAAILIAPMSGGVGLSVTALTFVVINGLAAALVGRFLSFPWALAGGVALGIAESEMARYVSTPGFSQAIPFLSLVLVLVLRGRGLPLRSHLLDRVARVGSGVVRWQVVLPLVAATGCAAWFANSEWVTAITATACAAIIMLSLVVVTGYAGQISLAQYAFAGIAAWVTGRLVAAHGWPFELALVAGVGMATVLGVIISIPALRIRGVSLAIVTLGLGIAIDEVLYSNPQYTGGLYGTTVSTEKSPLRFAGINIDSVSHPSTYALFVLGALFLCVLIIANLRRSAAGRRLVAVRTNERAAAALGVNVTAAKVYAFAVGSAIAGFGGVLLAFQDRTLQFDQFDPLSSITALAFAVLGGIGFLAGPLIGATLAVGGLAGLVLSKVFSQIGDSLTAWIAAFGGAGLFAIMLLNPDGIVGAAVDHFTARRRTVPLRSEGSPGRAETSPEPVVGRVRPSHLRLRGVSVRFGGVVALDRVDLSVAPGEVVGLIGPNGAGKTTLVDAVTGYCRTSAGLITVDEQPLEGLPPHRRARSGIGRSFQSLELFEDLSVRENLLAACDPRGLGSYARALVAPGVRSLSPAALAAVRELDLIDELDSLPSTLSYGRRRLVSIARALAGEPSVLLLDEPAAGLGALETAELGAVVRRLADLWGIAVLVIEHDMAFVMENCDRVVVLDFGAVVAAGPPAEIASDAAVRTAYLGDAVDYRIQELAPLEGGSR